jgi:hypothetical protein
MHWESLNMHVQFITSLAQRNARLSIATEARLNEHVLAFGRDSSVAFRLEQLLNISESMTLSATQVKKLASKSSTVAIRRNCPESHEVIHHK